tara:strand:- start:335 stop:619 length:285 start_codon:yes stop_codon:yes gene_type:complete
MAQNTTITVPAATWTQLTDADITSITFQNVGSNHIVIKATTDATAPTTTTGGFRYNPGQGERNVALSDLFPGIAARDRLWCYSIDSTSVVVSHA